MRCYVLRHVLFQNEQTDKINEFIERFNCNNVSVNRKKAKEMSDDYCETLFNGDITVKFTQMLNLIFCWKLIDSMT